MDQITEKKIAAYGIKKEGARVILEILSGAQGYSRKYDVVYRSAYKQSVSERKFANGLTELTESGFVELVDSQSDNRLLRINKKVWDRVPEHINLEHKTFLDRLNQAGRWLSIKSIIRDVRGHVTTQTGIKPFYIAVEIHLKTILSQNKHESKESGLIRLVKYRDSGHVSKTHMPILPLYELIGQVGSTQEKLEKKQVQIKKPGIDEIDEDLDLFSDLEIKEQPEEQEENDKAESEEAISEDIFGGENIFGIDEDYSIQDSDLSNVPPKSINDFKDGLSRNILISLSTFLRKKNPSFSIIDGFNELIIKFSELSFKIALNPVRNELIISSHFNMSQDRAIEALRMFSNPDMVGQLGIESIRGTDRLTLRKIISLSKYDYPETIAFAEKLIDEGCKISKL